MPDRPSARILIVDDEAAQMKALCDTLREHDYETAGFISGQPALAALRDGPFDLLLADLMMPEMSGIALLQAALEIDPHLVGIIMTGEGTIATAVEAMKSGAFDYILKPFTLKAIVPVLSRALAVRRLRLENAELEKRVRERTAELEAANKELDAFSYSVSHDLRAPLRAVHGFASILNQDFSAKMPGKGRELLNLVIANASRMEQLITDLLRFSQLGRQPLCMQPANMSRLTQEVLRDLHNEYVDRPVDVRVSDLPDALGDPTLLRQVVVNLLSNAFKFTRQKEHPVVEVGCEQQGGESVYFVRDNGAGFDMRYADRLFGVFQRLHRAGEFEGTGVGLSIVQRIIQRHRGRIWATAEVGRGATFFFTLGNGS